MSKKRQNPYREGSAYSKVFTDLRSAGQKGVSRKELIDLGHSPHDVTVILSPRAEGESKGDCRGSISAQGHIYFVSVKRKDNVKRHVLRWRKTELEPLKRQPKAKIEQKKVANKAAKGKSTKKTSEATTATEVELV